HDVAFPRQLGRITEVLDLTTAAHAEDRAERLRAKRRPRNQTNEAGDRVPLLDGGYRYASGLTRQRAQAENGHSPGKADGLPVRQKIVDRYLELCAGTQRRGSLRRCVSARQAS